MLLGRILILVSPRNTPEGRKAKEYVVELAEGKSACLAHDNIRGYYGRLLADVYVDGEPIKPKIQSFISR